MKRILAFISALLIMLLFAACKIDGEIEKTPQDSRVQEIITQLPAENDATKNTDDSNTDKPTQDKEKVSDMYLYITGNKLKVTLAGNAAADALVEILKQGDIIYTASDYGGFEKVGNLGHSLPSDNSQIETQSGDVILYSGNRIVLFYGSNSWSYTRLGKIEGYSEAELRTLLSAGKGDIEVRISLK